MSFTDALALLALAAFVWAEIWGTKEQQKMVIVGAVIIGVIWALTS